MPLRLSSSARATLVGLAAAAGVAAAGAPALAQAAKPKTFPFGSQWTLLTFAGKPVTENKPTIIVDESLRARGFAGCNTYSASAYPLPQQRFAVGPLAVTKKACDKALMDRERAFLVILRTAATWDVKDGQLVITGQNGELRFDRTL